MSWIEQKEKALDCIAYILFKIREQGDKPFPEISYEDLAPLRSIYLNDLFSEPCPCGKGQRFGECHQKAVKGIMIQVLEMSKNNTSPQKENMTQENGTAVFSKFQRASGKDLETFLKEDVLPGFVLWKKKLFASKEDWERIKAKNPKWARLLDTSMIVAAVVFRDIYQCDRDAFIDRFLREEDNHGVKQFVPDPRNPKQALFGNGSAHKFTSEVETWLKFFPQVQAGDVTPETILEYLKKVSISLYSQAKEVAMNILEKTHQYLSNKAQESCKVQPKEDVMKEKIKAGLRTSLNFVVKYAIAKPYVAVVKLVAWMKNQVVKGWNWLTGLFGKKPQLQV